MASQAYKNTGGVYANMDFPPYQYREYPKHIVVGPKGKYVVVNSQEEELKLKGELSHSEISSQLEAPYDPEKEALISKAKFLGVPINRLWSASKIQSMISQAETAIDNLPAESDEDDGEMLAAPTAEEIEDLHDLVQQAKDLGIKSARASWGVDRLKARIAEKQ